MDSRRRYLIANAIKSGGILPSGYKECEYIESTGTQYIDTGILAKNTTEVEIDIKILNLNKNYNYLFGQQESSKYLSLWYGGNLRAYGYLFGTIDLNYNLTTRVNIRDVFKLTKDYLYLNGNAVQTVGYTGTFKSNYSLYLLWANNSTRPKAVAKVYGFKIWDNSVLILSLIPCLDNNNVPCMYDTVSKTTFYNAGTGTFLYQLKS